VVQKRRPRPPVLAAQIVENASPRVQMLGAFTCLQARKCCLQARHLLSADTTVEHMSCMQTIQVSCGRITKAATHILDFCGEKWKMCFSPRGSVWRSFTGGVLLSFSLGLAVRTICNDLENFQIRPLARFGEGSGQHFGLGTFVQKKMSCKRWFCGGMILWWVLRDSTLPI